jgi:hypothetical protein
MVLTANSNAKEIKTSGFEDRFMKITLTEAQKGEIIKKH